MTEHNFPVGLKMDVTYPAFQVSLTLLSTALLTFEIKDASGIVVDTIEVDATGKGETAFAWDGVKANGERADAGAYTIKATHTASDGTGTALNTYVDATVDSVTIGSDGLYLNLPGLGTAPLDYVLRIGKSAS